LRFAPSGLWFTSSVERLEKAQIRRRLVLRGGHQQAVAAEVIDLLADADAALPVMASVTTSAVTPIKLK
jgi:hypothetical protein